MNAEKWMEYCPGVRVRRLGGERSMGFYLIRMDPSSTIPHARHLQEETFLVLEGSVELSCGISSTKSLLIPGISRTVPVDMEHEVTSESGALLLSVARPDWNAP